MCVDKAEEKKIGTCSARSAGAAACTVSSGTRLLIVDDEAAFLKLLVVNWLAGSRSSPLASDGGARSG